ncbi:MAG: thioredoxin fold domain-containing protein [Elusimicrobiaceae bacterium]|nr:thioredoxin fold domain-containing protein [Elusimicrobiaceae bacterium]
MSVIHVDDKNFDREVAHFTHPKMVVFSAGWCPHCQRMMPVLEKISQSYDGKVKVCVVDVTHAPKSTAKYSVRGVPTMLFFRDGKHFSQLVGEESFATVEEKIKGLL